MKKKYALAIIKGESEIIMGLFNTKAEADIYGKENLVPHSAGLQYCYFGTFADGKPVGKSIKVYNYYNV